TKSRMGKTEKGARQMRKHLLMSAALAALLAGGAVQAQTQTPEAPARATEAPQAPIPLDKPVAAVPPARAITQQQGDETRANAVIGMRVENAEKERIGKINDLVFDQQGALKAAVVSVGGFLGIGDKLVAIPWSEVKVNAEEKIALIGMNKE